MRHLHFSYTYTSPTSSLPFLFYRPDRMKPTTPTTPPLNPTSHQPATNKAIDTHTNEAEDAEQESIAQLYLYVMYVCMYTTRRTGVPEHELNQDAELHFLFDHDNCPAFVNLRWRWMDRWFRR
jgi:hypothetical protein